MKISAEIEVPWTVPFRESLTQRRIGSFLVRIWRNVGVNWEEDVDPVVMDFLLKIAEADITNKRILENKLCQIPGVTAIQIGDDNGSVLYVG